jgi:hypothetical protein
MHATWTVDLIPLDLVILIISVHFTPASCHSIPLRSKYPPQHSVLKHPQSMFLPYYQRPYFTPLQNYRQNIVLGQGCGK